MSIFDDINRFLETRLDEFLRKNPHLELQALEEQLREQEKDTLRLLISLQNEQKSLDAEIVQIGQDIQRWHARIEKARDANRRDLEQAAQEKEASLLRLGNQRWGQRKGVEERLAKGKELLAQIQQRQQEVKAKKAQAQAEQQRSQSAKSDKQNPGKKANFASGWDWSEPYSYDDKIPDPLEEKFSNWEAELEFEQMKRQTGR